jgi:hypothetical protein
VAVNLSEGRTIATIVTTWSAKSNCAAIKNLSDDRRDFADTVVLLVVAHVEDLVMDCFTWGVQN